MPKKDVGNFLYLLDCRTLCYKIFFKHFQKQ